MREFEFILSFKAHDEADAAFFIETKFSPLVKEMREVREAYGYVREVSSGSKHRVDAGDGKPRK